MISAAYVGDDTMRIDEVAVVPPGPGQVQVRVAYVGICGTDLHIVHGAMDARVTMPAVIGHEMSGVVESVGEGVTAWKPGDRVTVIPLDWDGTCPACLAGHRHLCHHLDFIGIDSPGAMQGLLNVRADLLLALPESLRLDHAALVEPVAVAVHDVRRGAVTPGDRVVVLGGGPIGVLIAVVARDAGAEVVVVEPDARRRGTVASLGFTTLDALNDDVPEAVDRWTAGAGADVVFEVSGAPAAVLTATSVAKVRGTVVVVAIHPQPAAVDLKQVFWRELTILGARVYERADFERAVALLDGGVVPADTLITDVRPLADVTAAFAALEQGDAMKILLDCGAPS
jgi:2-desacetyl-2-hydroxyethyl bacteriochlorophyllide A dehydrogenase